MSERRGEIQWLRAVAALEVVIVHSDLTTKHLADSSVIQGWYGRIGGIGVELFFVVSGFIICLVAPRAQGGVSFMLGRIRRIIPLCVIFTSLAAVIHLSASRYLVAPYPITPEYLLRSALTLPQWSYPILGPTWTLEHEMVFYLVVAGALLLGALTHLRKLALGAVVVALGCLGCWLGPHPDVSVWTFHLASPYMLAFGFGWLLCCGEQAGGRERAAIAAFCVGAVLLAFAVGQEWSSRLLLRVSVVTLVCAVVLQARGPLSADGAVNRMAWRLGDASFSLYLTHWFVLSGIGKIVAAAGVPHGLALPVRLTGILLAMAVGLVAYRLLEMPIDRFLRGLSRARRPAVLPVPARWAAGEIPVPERVAAAIPAPQPGSVLDGRVGP
ncbi:acyltransferase family protein [Methylobacterium oryzisoli]|uniref:acyltransferase family protein n=1 Tax=Methylobacterium oryzisoli TaxID=3385502 RepID=UPI003892B1E2